MRVTARGEENTEIFPDLCNLVATVYAAYSAVAFQRGVINFNRDIVLFRAR